MNDLSQRWLSWMIGASWQLALAVCLIALVVRLSRRASPRLRYALWAIVLVKAFVPPGTTATFGIGQWAIAPLCRTTGIELRAFSSRPPVERSAPVSDAGARHAGRATVVLQSRPTVSTILLCAWAAGGLLFWATFARRYVKLLRLARAAASIDEGPERVLLERLAIDLRLRRVPDLLVSDAEIGPCLVGVVQPRILLPRRLLAEPSDTELRAVLAHELAHWRRGDTWIGWLQAVAQSLFWFHPFLWWANNQLRHERECACDETVLRLGCVSAEAYGESMLRVLARLRGESWALAGFVGVFERGAKLQERFEEIMNYNPQTYRFEWAGRLVLAMVAAVVLPMSPGGGPAPAALAEKPAANETDVKAKSSWPRVLKSSPEKGATEVDPALTEISVTFDRDMGRGMSWIGMPPLFPPVDKTRQARWTDARTCVLPVKLAPASYYRLGINSSSYRNFRDSGGVAAEAAAIYFVTQGAGDDMKTRVRVPKVLSLEPRNGADEVDPGTTTLRVTFDVPMSEGMSWTGGKDFPKGRDGQAARWSDDGLTCVLPVSLEPGRQYTLGLNSSEHNNFQSRWAVPLEPMLYTFQTRPK